MQFLVTKSPLSYEISVVIAASSITALRLLSSSYFRIHVMKASKKVDKCKTLGSLQG